MNDVRIKDIYAGMPDAKDEFYTGQEENFYASFIIPPELPVENLLNGRKFLVSGYKGVGKTSVLYYLQNIVFQKICNWEIIFIYSYRLPPKGFKQIPIGLTWLFGSQKKNKINLTFRLISYFDFCTYTIPETKNLIYMKRGIHTAQ